MNICTIFLFLLALVVLIYLILPIVNNRIGIMGGKSSKCQKADPLKISYIKKVDDVITCYNNIDDTQLTPNSQFRIASLTKIFTAVAILIAERKGLLDIDDPVDKYCDFGLGDITIREVMNHKAGLYRSDTRPEGKEEEIKDLTEYVDLVIKERYPDGIIDDAKARKRGNEAYSNLGYNILGVILEKVTGMPWIEYETKEIIKPLHLKNTGMGMPNIPIYDMNSVELIDKKKWDSTTIIASGGLYSSINDLTKFVTNVHTLDFDYDKFRSLYFWRRDGTILEHTGKVPGGLSLIQVELKDKKVERIEMVLINGREGDIIPRWKR